MSEVIEFKQKDDDEKSEIDSIVNEIEQRHRNRKIEDQKKRDKKNDRIILSLTTKRIK